MPLAAADSHLRSAATDADGFAETVARMCREIADRWRAVPADMPALGMHVGRRRQWATTREALRLLDRMADEIDGARASPRDWDARRPLLRRDLERFGRERLGWPDGYGRLLVDEAMYGSTLAFFREALAFDARFPLDQLWQALRNVWVGNCLQFLLGRPVELRPALFAYSLLYPVTDNLLDDPSVSAARKRRFNERLGMRLAGRAVPAGDEREAQAMRLVELIESDLPRERFPCVYSSLLAIHAAQCRSLDQHDGRRLGDDELLTISITKGGTSVLADLLLIAGTADETQMRFAFGYGVVLQLLDDLQDVEADLAVGHETVFARAAVRHRRLDEPTARLARLIDEVLSDRGGDATAGGDERDLVRRHCLGLLVDSVAAHSERYSRAFRKRVASQWPVSLRGQRRLRRHARRLANGAATLLADWAVPQAEAANRAAAISSADALGRDADAAHGLRRRGDASAGLFDGSLGGARQSPALIFTAASRGGGW